MKGESEELVIQRRRILIWQGTVLLKRPMQVQLLPAALS